MKKSNYPYALFFGLMLGLMSMVSCNEETKFFGEPYPDGKPGIGIVIDRTQVPVPASGEPGTEVFVKASGLMPYRDRLTFRINGEKAEIKEVSEEGITVIVPTFASTGITSVSVDDMVVFGP